MSSRNCGLNIEKKQQTIRVDLGEDWKPYDQKHIHNEEYKNPILIDHRNKNTQIFMADILT